MTPTWQLSSLICLNGIQTTTHTAPSSCRLAPDPPSGTRPEHAFLWLLTTMPAKAWPMANHRGSLRLATTSVPIKVRSWTFRSRTFSFKTERTAFRWIFSSRTSTFNTDRMMIENFPSREWTDWPQQKHLLHFHSYKITVLKHILYFYNYQRVFVSITA